MKCHQLCSLSPPMDFFSQKLGSSANSFNSSFLNPTIIKFNTKKFRNSIFIEESIEESDEIIPGPVVTFHSLNYEILFRSISHPCQRTYRKLLTDVSGVFQGGLNAILGPTGCGKTTLIDLLADRKNQRNMSGNILVDGKKRSADFNQTAGYVVQDDLIMGTLTVRENLMFSANMRLPRSVGTEEKKRRVAQIIEDLGLEKCADSKVGNEFIRGVSGGERKRTCIGMELIVSPSILFLDEPTTGLDASTAHSVMYLLKRLSRNGLTVIFSIHQPRYSIFKLFDTLMLLADGFVVYHGKASLAINYFSNLNYAIEAHNNPSDFFLDILNGTASSFKDISNSFLNSDSVLEDKDSGFSCNSSIIEKEKIIQTLTKKYLESKTCKSIDFYLQEKLNEYLERGSEKSIEIWKNTYPTSFFTQMNHVSRRTLKNVIRNPAAAISQILLMLIFAIITGVLFFDLTRNVEKGMQDRAGAFFFIVMIQMFGNMSAVELFLKERVLFLHETKAGFYRVSVYFFSKLFCDLLPMRMIPLSIFCLITYFMMGLVQTADKFFIYFLNLFLTTFTSAILAFTISASVKMLAVANILVGLVCIIMMLFGGLLINISSIPSWIRWLQYFSIVRFSFKGLLINELKDAIFFHYNGSVQISDNSSSHKFLESQNIKHETPWDLWQNMVSLSIIGIVLLIICYIKLKFLSSKKQ